MLLAAGAQVAAGENMVARLPVSVVLSEFEDIVSRGLQALIEEDPALALLEGDVAHDRLHAALERWEPQVALLNFGSLSSSSEVRDIHRSFPATRLVVLANRPTAPESRQLLAFGATACLAKSTQARDVLHAIHLASRGLHVMPPAVVEEAGIGGPELLTSREGDVLELLQSGRSNAEIAQTLHVSVETVRTHVRRILRKLGVKTRRDLRTGS
jgi:NarL family two-component system response regulator LiaR